MMTKYFGMVLIVYMSVVYGEKAIFDELTYQDIIVNNQCVQKGERNCAPTYELIKKVLDQMHKPLSVLDIGAAQGYFSFRIAYDYHAICVMLEGGYDYQNHTNQLLTLCKLNKLPNTVFLQTHITPALLRKLAEREHFDVVLALNFIHHCGYDWREMADAVIMLGDTIIIEHPPYDEFQGPTEPEWIKRAAIAHYLQQLGAWVVGEVPRHTTHVKKSQIYCLQKNTSISHVLSIKPTTFVDFGGVYPLPYL